MPDLAAIAACSAAVRVVLRLHLPFEIGAWNSSVVVLPPEKYWSWTRTMPRAADEIVPWSARTPAA